MSDDEKRIPDGTRVRIKSEHFAESCVGVVRESVFDGGWLYRVGVLSGNAPKAARHGDGEIWVCAFELERVT